MKTYYWTSILLGLGLAIIFSPLMTADELLMKDGTRVEGIVKKVENGQVVVQIGQTTRNFNILDVTSMDFSTAQMMDVTGSKLPLEHFLANIEAQEMLGHFQSVEKSATEVRKLVDQTKKDWSMRKTIESNEVAKWDATKERLIGPLADYQEHLNDLYFHVLGKVDEYNRLMADANTLYIGVKGVLQTGSSLVPRDKVKLPLKKYVPSQWYDTIFYEGYNLGYNDAYKSYTTTFHEEPPVAVNPDEGAHH